MKQMGVSIWKSSISFSDNICVKDGCDGITTFIEYNDIIRINFEDEATVLWLNEHNYLRVPNASFTKGTYENFILFIKEKTNL
ncbi:hypothetical protein [Anaerorhabdus sp.]|uniref:hypothetical protein n=1 Tax=Anaerorhabdus sp. TaxID=1872524 RepID=UPI003A893E50